MWRLKMTCAMPMTLYEGPSDATSWILGMTSLTKPSRNFRIMNIFDLNLPQNLIKCPQCVAKENICAVLMELLRQELRSGGQELV
jgi:hypothetical protein